MTRLSVLLIAVLLALASSARAQSTDGSQCTDCDQANNTVYLCGGQIATGTDTVCGPIVLPERADCLWVVRINKVQATCPFPAMLVEESDQDTTGAPTVWHTVETLTGPVSPQVSQLIPNPPRRIGPGVRATFTDITDANCTDVRVVVRCQ